MKKPVFKIGDYVTYKCTKDLPNGEYIYSGNDIGGHVGEIVDISEYNSEHDCYVIEVTADCDEASCGSYSLLEFEVLEYDTIIKSMSEDEDTDDEDIDDDENFDDEEEIELYDLAHTSRQFQVGDTVYIKKCDSYRYQSNSDVTEYYGKPGRVVYNEGSEFLLINRGYDVEIEFDDSEEDRLWFLECELTKTEIQGEPESDTYPKLVKHTDFGDLMEDGDDKPHCISRCIYAGICKSRSELTSLCNVSSSYYFAKPTQLEESIEPTKEVKPTFPDISNTLTEFDHFFKVKSPLTDLFQQFIEEIMGIDNFLAEVDIDYIREADFDITSLKNIFINIRASLFIDIPFYEDFEITEKAEDLWDNLLTQYKIHDDAKIEHNRYSELLSKSKPLTCATDEIFVISTKTESTAQISEDAQGDQFFTNTTSKIFNF